jgi:hypothetical protein
MLVDERLVALLLPNSCLQSFNTNTVQMNTESKDVSDIPETRYELQHCAPLMSYSFHEKKKC